MDHAEVRERLDAAFLSGGRLAELERDGSDEGMRTHLASCRSCARELEALRETAGLLAYAAPDDLRAPARSRAAVLSAVRETGVARRRRTWSDLLSNARVAWLAAGAAVLLVAATALAGLTLASQRDELARETQELAQVAAFSDRLLRDPTTTKQTLRDASGASAGSILYNSADRTLVVISNALQPPPRDDWYGCYVVDGGKWTEVGRMWFSDDLAYWAGPVNPSPAAGSGATFVVALHSKGQQPALNAPL